MGMTIIEKIFARASHQAKVAAGDLVVVDVDVSVMLDSSFHANHRRRILKVHDPEKIVVVYDHMVPAPDKMSAEGHVYGREFVKQFGIRRFHDVGPDQGISHAVVADRGLRAAGHRAGVWRFPYLRRRRVQLRRARGRWPDLLCAVTTGKTWFQVGETVRYDLRRPVAAGRIGEGRLPPSRGHLRRTTPTRMSSSAVRAWRISASTRGAPLPPWAPSSARSSRPSRPTRPCSTMCEPAIPRRLKRNTPTPMPRYVERRTIDLDAMEPLVALPDTVIRNSVPVGDVERERIHQAFIGSCANGTLDDLAEAARVVKGKKVAPGVRFLVTPGTQDVFQAALVAGYVQTLMEAGAVVTPATCGACFGGHMGVLGAGETCITASTRNFKGRMGDPSARIFMASPATVAASAIAGHIVNPAKIA